MPLSMSQSVMGSMKTWNDFTDLPDEFLSQFGPPPTVESESTPKKCFYSLSFAYFATSMDEVLLFACAVATIFNLIVIGCSWKLYKGKGDTLHLFILNMTVGDLILTVLCHPYELVTRRFIGAVYPSITVFLNFANWVGLAVSGLSLTLLNFDKLIFFCWPFKYDTWMSYFRAKFFCYLIWIVSIGFGTYYWMYSYMYFIDRKVEIKNRLEIQFIFMPVFMSSGKLSPLNKFFYESFTLVFCVIPIISSFFVSLFLYDLTRRKKKLLLELRRFVKKDHKAASSFAFIFATTLWTSFSLLPYRIANIIRIHMIPWATLSCENKQSWSWLTWCMLYLLILNPIVNPFITAFAYAPYRKIICGIYARSPIGRFQSYMKKLIITYIRKKTKKFKKNSELKIIFYLELPIDFKELLRKAEEESIVTTRRAPLVHLHSICSFDSLESPNSEKFTNF